MRPAVRLLAIDIDGTLLDSSGRLPALHREAVADAAASGIAIVLATGRTLHFTATAGSIRLRDGKDSPLTDIAFVAYQVEQADPARRPVTFVFNGGPGMASAWLQVGAVGPWRVRLDPRTDGPSAAPAPVPNADTWLDYYSRRIMLPHTLYRVMGIFVIVGSVSLPYLAQTTTETNKTALSLVSLGVALATARRSIAG